MDQLALEHEVHSRSSEEHNEVDRTEWRKLLWPIRNVKTFSIDNGLFDELSRCLQSEDGELVLGLLPKLQELTFSQYDDNGDAFTSFINARQNTDRAVILVLP